MCPDVGLFVTESRACLVICEISREMARHSYTDTVYTWTENHRAFVGRITIILVRIALFIYG